MKKKDERQFKSYAVIGFLASILFVGWYYGIFQGDSDLKIAAGHFINIVGITGIVTLGFFLFTGNAVFGARIDGFITASGFVTSVAKGLFTGEWV